jgi:hypothetical protein
MYHKNVHNYILLLKYKERTMANKKNLLGILVMTLIFGMTVVGCPPEERETELKTPKTPHYIERDIFISELNGYFHYYFFDTPETGDWIAENEYNFKFNPPLKNAFWEKNALLNNVIQDAMRNGNFRYSATAIFVNGYYQISVNRAGIYSSGSPAGYTDFYLAIYILR